MYEVRRGRTKPPRKRHSRRRASAAKRKRDKLARENTKQEAVTKADVERLGHYAVEEARTANAKKIQRQTIRGRDGQLYYRTPGGPFVKTSGKAVEYSDGTLVPLRPDPRPTKRERVKAKRRLKREARNAEETTTDV